MPSPQKGDFFYGKNMNKEIRPLPQPTLKMIDPVEGSKEFRDVFRPMYGSLSMGAYELILSGERPKKRGDNRYIDQKKYFVKENGETPKWERLARRLDRNFYAFLYPHINHNGMEKQESPDNEVQKKIIKDIISALPLGKDTVAELKRKLDLDESQFSKEKLIAASAHFSMLLREGNTLNPFINKNLFPTHGNLLENRNEITVPSNRPSKMLRRATGNDIHPRLQHEGRLQGLLTL